MKENIFIFIILSKLLNTRDIQLKYRGLKVKGKQSRTKLRKPTVDRKAVVKSYVSSFLNQTLNWIILFMLKLFFKMVPSILNEESC